MFGGNKSVYDRVRVIALQPAVGGCLALRFRRVRAYPSWSRHSRRAGESSQVRSRPSGYRLRRETAESTNHLDAELALSSHEAARHRGCVRPFLRDATVSLQN